MGRPGRTINAQSSLLGWCFRCRQNRRNFTARARSLESVRGRGAAWWCVKSQSVSPELPPCRRLKSRLQHCSKCDLRTTPSQFFTLKARGGGKICEQGAGVWVGGEVSITRRRISKLAFLGASSACCGDFGLILSTNPRCGLRSDCGRKEKTGEQLVDSRTLVPSVRRCSPVGVNLQRCSRSIPQRNYRLRLLGV